MSVTIMMPSGRTEKCSKPGTCRRHAPHANAGNPTRTAFLNDVQAATGNFKEQPAPIKVRATKLHEPNADAAVISYETPDSMYPNKYFDMEMDYTEGDGDYYGGGTRTRIRYATVSGVHHLPEILASTFGAQNKNDVPASLIAYAKEQGLDQPAAYDVSIHEGDDYYDPTDDSYSVALNADSMAKLKTWYYNQVNAVDDLGILPYVRSKGVDTTGLTPLEAIKRQLTAEHPKLAARITKANNVSLTMLARGDIDVVDQKQLATATKIKDWQKTAPSVNAGGVPATFEGILYRTHKRGAPWGYNYRLLDGFNRYKSRTTKRTVGRYIVLSA